MLRVRVCAYMMVKGDIQLNRTSINLICGILFLFDYVSFFKFIYISDPL